MILVTGAIVAKPDTVDEIKRMALEHVRRSREEPGCLHHSVQVDCENPLRLVFVERWADKAALATHFRVSASGGFVRAAAKLASAPPEIAIYDATETNTQAVMS